MKLSRRGKSKMMLVNVVDDSNNGHFRAEERSRVVGASKVAILGLFGRLIFGHSHLE